MKDYYLILEISQDSSEDEIKQAYRRLAKKFHPDINKAKDAHERFIEISEAYEVLLHRVKNSEAMDQVSDYEQFVSEIREQAKKQARMRYERFVRQHEAFRESGLYDASLLLKYIGKVVLLVLAPLLVLVPVLICFLQRSVQPFFYLFFLWFIGGFLLYVMYQDRRAYFKLGKFYYNIDKLLDIYRKTNEYTSTLCSYCDGLKANSLSVKVDMIKVRDVNLRHLGPLQHQVGYKRKNYTIIFPRSQKAFIVHSVVSFVKLFSILFSLFFFPLSSVIWRLIGGIFIGWLVASAILLFTHTRSKCGYLFSLGMLIKVAMWLGLVSFLSVFYFSPFDIQTSPYINFGITLFLFLDAFFEQLLKLPKGLKLFVPFLKGYQVLLPYFEKRCLLYLEIPFWTSIYPFVRWIF